MEDLKLIVLDNIEEFGEKTDKYLKKINETNELNQAFENIAKGISVLNHYDLYIFLEPDVEWVQDGTRTYGDPKVREENNKKLKAIFDENNINYVCINGNYHERYERSKKEIEKVMYKGRQYERNSRIIKTK